MGITISTVHDWWTGEFEEPVQLDIWNNSKYRLKLAKHHLNRGQVLSNRGEPLEKIPARQGVAWCMLRIRGDRTGSEQPHWLKPDDVCLHMTMSYALMDNNIDSGLKMVLKIYRPEKGEPVLHARILRHHDAATTINKITEEHNEPGGTVDVEGIELTWVSSKPKSGRLCEVRLEKATGRGNAQASSTSQAPAAPAKPASTFQVQNRIDNI